MDYLVTLREDLSLEGYARVTSLGDIITADKTSVILLHSFSEDAYRASLEITELNQNRGICKFIYINEDPHNDVSVLIQSLKGTVETDESLLEDIDEIKDLVSLQDELNELAVVDNGPPAQRYTSIRVLNEFVQKYKEGDASLQDPLYLEMVNRAVTDISSHVEIQGKHQMEVSKTVVSTYNNTLKIVNQLYDEIKGFQEQVDELETTSRNFAYTGVDSLTYFPSITYAGNIPVVVFKEVSACRYLTSFVLAYANHLETVKNLRVKVIIVAGKQTLVSNRYRNFHELTKDNYTNAQSILEKVTYTVSPIKNLLLHYTKQSDEVLIILDRTYEKDAIMKGRSTILYGVSGRNEVLRENLNVKDCITTIKSIKNSLATIKHIGGFPEDIDSRLDEYSNSFNDDFNRISARVGI